jgi:hypothetical protein
MVRWRRPRPPEPAPGSAPFKIIKINTQPPPLIPTQPTPVPAPEKLFVARFPNGAGALSLIAAVRDRAPVRRAKDGAVWVEVPGDHPAEEQLAWALGAVVYHPSGAEVVAPSGGHTAWSTVRSWPEVSPVELATAIGRTAAATEQTEVLVVTTGPLASWIINRFKASGLELAVATARLRSLFRRPAEEWPAVLIGVSGRGRAVPRSALEALGGLPHTVVCRHGDGRLLVDQHLRLPMPDADLATAVPADQQWLLTSELGAWRVTSRGPKFPPPTATAPGLEPPAVPVTASFPPDLRVDVSFVLDDRPLTANALLLTDDELTLLRVYLADHPAGERGFLILGPGVHLYAEPALTVADIPFGIALHRVGPGALFQQVGYRLKPALSGPARAELFGMDDETVVILGADRAYRLALTRAVPVWSLWLGAVADPPDAKPEPLSAAAAQILDRVDAADARVDASAVTGGDGGNRTGPRTEGFKLEQQGRFSEAAHLYWEAGEFALAARLYEQAAEAGE